MSSDLTFEQLPFFRVEGLHSRYAKELRDRCVSLLRVASDTQTAWVRVHALEALIGVEDRGRIFSKVLASFSSDGGSRIGEWRILARCCPAGERSRWLARIEECFVEQDFPVRLTALESLCKLDCALSGEALRKAQLLAEADLSSEYPFALWALQLSGLGRYEEKIAAILSLPDPALRKLAAFVLRWLKCKDARLLEVIVQALANETNVSEAYPFLLGAVLSLRADEGHPAAWKTRIEGMLESGSDEGRYEVCQALQQRRDPEFIPCLLPFLDLPNTDVNISAAAAIITALESKI